MPRLTTGLAVAGVLTLLSGPVAARDKAAEPAPPATILLAEDEIDSLVTRVALYPDPLLALVLQASTLPLDVVQAARFLDKRAKNPALAPDPAWDTSIVGLLNYPSVLAMMNDDLDWTEGLGAAVVQQLPDVQASVQQIRSELQAAGALASNDKQTVVVDERAIKIEPANPEVIYVPVYQPAPAPVPAAAAPAAAPATYAAPTPAPTAYASPAPATYGTPAPTTYAAPPVTYSDPYPSFWSHTAAFAGGAVVGGVLGYAIGKDNNNNNNDNNDTIEIELDDDIDWDEVEGNYKGRGGINIEDSNVVVAGGNRAKVDRQTQLAQSQLKANQTRAVTATPQQRAQARAQVAQRPAGAGAAQTRSATRQAQGVQRPVAATKAVTTPDTRTAQPQRPAAAKAAAIGDVQPRKEARKEADRGARSRAAAPQASPSAQGQAAPTRLAAAQQRPGAFAGQGGDVQREAGRGARSRGDLRGR
jgi:uncharacterized protein DUF3300